VVFVREAPLLAAVVAAEDAALLGLDDGVHAAGIRGRDGDPQVAPHAFRQTVALEALPGVAAVGRATHLTSRTAALEGPGLAHDLPEAGVQDARVRRIHRELRSAGLVVDEADLLPALAAVFRAEDPALGAGSEGVALGRHVD